MTRTTCENFSLAAKNSLCRQPRRVLGSHTRPVCVRAALLWAHAVWGRQKATYRLCCSLRVLHLPARAHEAVPFHGRLRHQRAVKISLQCRGLILGTPNGWKASILLKELKYPHKVHSISLSKSDQKQDWFVKINPNGRIPAIGAHYHNVLSSSASCALDHG